MPLETLRDRNGSYEPKIIGKGQTRFAGFRRSARSLWRGTRPGHEHAGEIQSYLEEIYKVEVKSGVLICKRHRKR